MRFGLSSLQQEIQNQKRKLESDDKRPKKYVRRGEAEKEAEEAYLKEQEEKNKQKEEAERLKIGEIKKQYAIAQNKLEVPQEIPPEEVKKRLTKRREPITLFGENDEMRAERLRHLERIDPMEYIETNEFEGSDFLRRMEDDEYEEDIEVQKKKRKKKKIQILKSAFGTQPHPKKKFYFFFKKSFVT